jgi:hypothetical protein
VEPELFDELVSLEDEYWWLVGRRRAHGHHRRYTRHTLETALGAAALHVTRAGFFVAGGFFIGLSVFAVAEHRL